MLLLPCGVLLSDLTQLHQASRAHLLNSHVDDALRDFSLEVIRGNIIKHALIPSLTFRFRQLPDSVPDDERMGTLELLLRRHLLVNHAAVHYDVLLEAILQSANVINSLQDPITVAQRRRELGRKVTNLVGLVDLLDHLVGQDGLVPLGAVLRVGEDVVESGGGHVVGGVHLRLDAVRPLQLTEIGPDALLVFDERPAVKRVEVVVESGKVGLGEGLPAVLSFGLNFVLGGFVFGHL